MSEGSSTEGLGVGDVCLVKFRGGVWDGYERVGIYVGAIDSGGEAGHFVGFWLRVISGSSEEFKTIYLGNGGVSVTKIGRSVVLVPTLPTYGSAAIVMKPEKRWWWPRPERFFLYTLNGFWRWQDGRAAVVGGYSHLSTAPGRVQRAVDKIQDAMRDADLVNGIFGRIR